MDAKRLYTAILKLKLPWYIDRIEVDEHAERVDIFVEHEDDIQVACPECGKFYGMYDHGPERVFQHLDCCEMKTFIHVRPPRVKCPDHGTRNISEEFGDNHSDMTYAMERRVIALAQECSVASVGRLTGLSWDRCWSAFTRAVNRGQARKGHRLPTHLAVDEKSFAKGHKYETIVVDHDRGTVEYVGDDRTTESLAAYYRQFSEEERAAVEVVTMDMWDAFINATREHIPDANRKIVFDRFHVMKHVVEAVDKVRRAEHKELTAAKDSTLKHTKYLWLYSEENIPAWRADEFEELKNMDLKVCRAWAIKENLRHLWEIDTEELMRRYFASWFGWARRSKIYEIKKVALTVKNHIDNIVTYAQHRITNAISESLNSKIEKVKRWSCGFRNRNNYKTAIFFHCGGLDLMPQERESSLIRFRPCKTQLVGATH